MTSLKPSLLLFIGLATATPSVSQESAVLRVFFPGGQAVLGPSDLAALPRDSVRARVHDGPERWYAGPSLIAVLRRAGARVDTIRGPALAHYVLAEARDGYRVLFSLAELAPALGNERVLLVDRMDGQTLPLDDGPWRLLVPGEAHPTRWARQVVTIRVGAVPP